MIAGPSAAVCRRTEGVKGKWSANENLKTTKNDYGYS